MSDSLTKLRRGQPSRLPDLLGAASVSTLVLAATWALTQLGRPTLDAVAKAAPPQSLLHLVLLLSVALLFALVWAFSLRRQLRHPTSAQFDFDEYGGFYIDRRTRLGVCTRCLTLDEPRVVHLMDVGGNKKCNACEQVYRGKNEK